jgi:hypothetical protein
MPSHELASTSPAASRSERDAPDVDERRRILPEVLMYASPVVGLSIAGLGFASLFGGGPRLLRRHPLASAALALGGTALLAKSQLDRYFLDEPDYKVEREVDGLEVRTYAPRLVAETTVDASDFEEARKQAFQRLARYLSGDNVPREHLSMTVPVSVARRETAKKGQKPAAGTATLAASPHGYVMQFQMPKRRRKAELPRPTDARVSVKRLPRARVAVIRFSGTYSPDKIAEKERELLERVRALGLQPAGSVCFAGYDSPAALPPFRRVEVWVPIA